MAIPPKAGAADTDEETSDGLLSTDVALPGADAGQLTVWSSADAPVCPEAAVVINSMVPKTATLPYNSIQHTRLVLNMVGDKGFVNIVFGGVPLRFYLPIGLVSILSIDPYGNWEQSKMGSKSKFPAKTPELATCTIGISLDEMRYKSVGLDHLWPEIARFKTGVEELDEHILVCSVKERLDSLALISLEAAFKKRETEHQQGQAVAIRTAESMLKSRDITQERYEKSVAEANAKYMAAVAADALLE